MTQLELDFGEEFAPKGKTDPYREVVINLANDMALFASIWVDDGGDEINDLVKFAKLVAAKEREACAELRKTLSAIPSRHVPQLQPAVESALDFYAERIRARGEA